MNNQYPKDFGALWPHPDGEGLAGKIYGQTVHLKRNLKWRDGGKLPRWHIVDPQATETKIAPDGSDATGQIGALWAKHHAAKNLTWFNGHIRLDGEKHDVALWPNTNRKSENSPHYRVMPPRESKTEPAVEQVTIDDGIPF